MSTYSTSVNVTVDGILLTTNESIAHVNIGNGYSIEKIKLQDFKYFTDIVDGKNKLIIDYYNSRLIDELSDDEQIYFMCFKKTDNFIAQRNVEGNIISITTEPFFNNDIQKYMDDEFEHINKTISKLQVYNVGNIGIHKVYFNFKYSFVGNNTFTNSILIKDANTINPQKYVLSEDEAKDYNNFSIKYDHCFNLTKNIIDEFCFGLKQIDVATAFEQHTTCLEMFMLEKNNQNKKQCLSKRTAVALYNTDTDVVSAYTRMKEFYKFRSESLHDGDFSNITKVELEELENITRLLIKQFLEYMHSCIANNPSETLATVKAKWINMLKAKVMSYQSHGLLQ
ncbi:hypothetical protein ACE38V_15735 [Cytobacillus sp. Hz8]|uniref:hypothetical protein n=1 Tax=Cytobacillus sp. Hz8 TaxID=3347168 RepID=UPI0035DD2A51